MFTIQKVNKLFVHNSKSKQVFTKQVQKSKKQNDLRMYVVHRSLVRL